MDTFSCGLGDFGSKLSSQPEHALKQLSTKPTGTSWGSSPAASQRRSPESLRSHGSSAHTKPAGLLQQHLPVCSTLHQHTGQSPAGESISVPTTRGLFPPLMCACICDLLNFHGCHDLIRNSRELFHVNKPFHREQQRREKGKVDSKRIEKKGDVAHLFAHPVSLASSFLKWEVV